MGAEEHPAQQGMGRTRHRHCRCGREKMQVAELDTGKPTLVLCVECDKAPLEVILNASTP